MLCIRVSLRAASFTITPDRVALEVAQGEGKGLDHTEDGDEGHEVEEGGDNREDHLHHQEFEGEFDLKGMDHIKDSVGVTIVCLTLMKSLT